MLPSDLRRASSLFFVLAIALYMVHASNAAKSAVPSIYLTSSQSPQFADFSGDCRAACTRTQPCKFSGSLSIAVTGSCQLVLLQGVYASSGQKMYSLTHNSALDIAFSGSVSIPLQLSAPLSTLVSETADAIVKNSTITFSRASNIAIKLNAVNFVDTVFNVNPQFANSYNARWEVTDCTFTSESLVAGTSIFTAKPPTAVTPAVTNTFVFTNVVASLLSNTTGKASFFITSGVAVDKVQFVNSRIDGASVLLNLADNGYLNALDVISSSITGVQNYVIGFARALATNPQLYVSLVVTDSKISGVDVTSSHVVPRLSQNMGVSINGTKANFSSLSINCVDNTRSETFIGGAITLTQSTLHNCAACFGRSNRPTIADTAFTYNSEDPTLVFTYFYSLNNGSMKNVSFTDWLELDFDRLVIGGQWNTLALDSSIQTNSLYLEADTVIGIPSLTITGTVRLEKGARISSPFLPNSQWTFLCPVNFRYVSNDKTGSAMVDLSGAGMLNIRPSNEYPYSPGTLSIFYNDPEVTVQRASSNQMFSATHIIWDAMRFDIPLSNVPYFIGNFTFISYNSADPSSGNLPMLPGDEYPFSAALQAVTISKKIYRVYFTLGNTSPLYVPTAHWPATPFAPVLRQPKPSPPTSVVPSGGSQACSGIAPTAPKGNSGRFSCVKGSWIYPGDMTVSALNPLTLGVRNGPVLINGSLTMLHHAQILFKGSDSRLTVNGCIDGLDSIVYNFESGISTPSADTWTVQAVTQQGCSNKRALKPSEISVTIMRSQSCVSLVSSPVISSNANIFTVQFIQDAKQCRIIYGLIGGILVPLILAGIIIFVILCWRRQRKNEKNRDQYEKLVSETSMH